jgi:hypothetical protein
MIHMLASALTACALIPAVEATSATASKGTRAILTFLMDAKVSIASIPFDSCVQVHKEFLRRKYLCSP